LLLMCVHPSELAFNQKGGDAGESRE